MNLSVPCEVRSCKGIIRLDCNLF